MLLPLGPVVTPCRGDVLERDVPARRQRCPLASPRAVDEVQLEDGAILAKTLGIHIKAAIQWQKISSGDWTSYAAEISHRNQPEHDNPKGRP